MNKPNDLTKRYIEKVRKDGNHCPECHNSDISGGSVEVQANTAFQEVACNNCGAEWNDLYTLSGVEILSGSDEDYED